MVIIVVVAAAVVIMLQRVKRERERDEFLYNVILSRCVCVCHRVELKKILHEYRIIVHLKQESKIHFNLSFYFIIK